MASLHPCGGCARHVRVGESSCPFCGAAVAENVVSNRGAPAGNKRLTRAAILFATAAVAASCGGKEDPVPNTSSSSGTSGTSGSSGTSGTSGTAVPAYGVPETDSGPDANDGGGPVALYGPAPVDASDG